MAGQIYEPMLCEISPVFDSPDFIWENKLDGIRAIVTVSDKLYHIQARSGTDKTALFPDIQVKTRVPAVLDGEIVCYKDGKPAFNLIQHRTNRSKGITVAIAAYPATYVVFDILEAAGQDLRGMPLMKRKEWLEKILIPSENVKLGEFTDGAGTALFQNALDNAVEGVVGKAKNGIYTPGARNWLKCKISQEDTFAIVGYTQGTGWRANSFGALILARVPPLDKLSNNVVEYGMKYVGQVGTGFDSVEIQRLYSRMSELKVGSSPMGYEPPGLLQPTWLKPTILCRVKFLEYTNDGVLRFPSYKEMVN